MKWLVLFVLIFLCGAASAVFAMPITDPSQLSANPTIIDFEGVTIANPLTIGDVTFTSLTGSLVLFDISHWPANGTEVESTTLFPGAEPDSAIAIDFATPVSEFLLGWADPNYPGNVLQAYDANGSLLEEAAVELGPVGGVHAAWIGFKRQTADIARVVVQPDQSRPSGDDYVIDNIHYSRVIPEVMHVSIDIKPGSDPNCFNNNGHGVIPVAILSTDEFDASTVDPVSVFLDGAGSRVRGKSGNVGALEDIDQDGDSDLVLQIEDVDGTYQEGHTLAVLTGSTWDNQAIEGTDTICIVP